MKILPPPEVDTEGWADEVHQHQPPDWSGVSPEEVARRGQPWNQDPSQRPWFDQDGAAQSINSQLTQKLISADEARLMTQWVRDGYFVLENAIDPSQFDLLDAYARELDGLWVSTDEPLNMQFSGVRVNGVRRGPVDHAELLSWPLELRLKCRDTQSWRIHYYQSYTQTGRELAHADRLMRMCNLLLKQYPALLNLTAFKYSSEVGHHQDLMFYHVHPANHMVGVWLACEDVQPEAGPLAVYPGSHRIPIWPGFSNYPQTSYRTCHRQGHIDFENYLIDSVSEDNRLRMPIKKGDAVFLNGLCVHGADKAQARGELTRFSIVFHYTIPGADKRLEIEGPFNY